MSTQKNQGEANVLSIRQWFEREHGTGLIIDGYFALLGGALTAPRNCKEADDIVLLRMRETAAESDDVRKQMGHYLNYVLSVVGGDRRMGEDRRIADARAAVFSIGPALRRIELLITGCTPTPGPYEPPDYSKRFESDGYDVAFKHQLNAASGDLSLLRDLVQQYRMPQGQRAVRLYGGALIPALEALRKEVCNFRPAQLADALSLAEAIEHPIFAQDAHSEPLRHLKDVRRICDRYVKVGSDADMIERICTTCSRRDHYKVSAGKIEHALECVSSLTRALITARALAHRLSRLRDPHWTEDQPGAWLQVGTWLENRLA